MIRSLLSLVKDPMDPKLQKGVYSIPCSCGLNYIGETGRSFQVRIKEHKAAITHNREKSSDLAEHSMRTKHHICIEDAKILARVDHLSKMHIREAMEIMKEKNV
jgi:hypothetical protein